MINVTSKKRFVLSIINTAICLLFFNKFLKKVIKKVSKLHCLEIKKILIIELWGIGDLVMMSSILATLKKNYPDAHISLLCKPIAKILFNNTNFINEFIEFDFPWTRFKGKYIFWRWDWKGLIRIIWRLRREKFDLVLDARGDFRNHLLSFFAGTKRRIGYAWTGEEYLLTDAIDINQPDRHRVTAWANLLSYLGMTVENPKPHIYIPESEIKWAEEFLRKHNIEKNDLLIGLHPGGRIKTRCWSLDKFAKLTKYLKDKYKAKIIIFVEPEGYGDKISVEGDYLRVKVQLRELIALIKKLKLLICNDCGVMHIATAVNTPMVAIFGPGDLKSIGPYGGNHRIVIKEGFRCRPCYDYCKYKEPYCLTGISIEDVAREVDAALHKLVLPV
jgi:lipopolysaccharide heptosyltransferase II